MWDERFEPSGAAEAPTGSVAAKRLDSDVSGECLMDGVDELTAWCVELARKLEDETARRVEAESALGSALAGIAEREWALNTAERLAQVGSWIWHVDGGAVRWSDQVHRIFGTDPASPPGDFDVFVAMVHPDDRDEVLDLIKTAMASGQPYEVQHRIVAADGSIRDVASRGSASLDADRRPVRIAGSVQDVTEARAASARLQRSLDLFAGVLNATEQAIIATDPSGLVTVFNTGAERLLGYAAGEVIGHTCERFHDPVEVQARAVELGVEPGFQALLGGAAHGEPETRRWTYVTRHGRRLQAMITVNAIRGVEGSVTGFIKVGVDVTAQLAAQAALRDSESRLRDIFEFAPNGMMLIDASRERLGRFLKVNPALTELTGYSEEQLLHMSVADLTHAEHLQAHRDRFEALRDQRPTDYAVERHWVHADGHDLWVQFNVSPLHSQADAYVIGQVEDITARKHAEARLTHQALHDWLTGLPNRVLLMDRIEHALTACHRSGTQVGLLYLDLDGFKAINDTGGHAVGDHALIEVAKRIRSVVRIEDTVARLSGDEFVVVCGNVTDVNMVTAVADRILTALREPHVHAALTFSLGASIGVALSTADASVDELLRDADAAMYSSKSAGKGRIRVSGPDDQAALDNTARAIRTIRIEGELAQALDNGELVLFGQSTHDLITGRIVAVENLLRWRHPTRGLLGPNEFLDVAEASDLMIPIGRWVINESCRMAADWVDQLGDDAPAVNVNISGRQLEAGRLSTDVLQGLGEHALPASKLVLELTETHMPMLADSLRRDILGLREQGVRVAIDDLGTGYSSLTRITQLPVDMLKIDLSFVAGMDVDPACAAVVRGILAIGQALGLVVVAEGVETHGQADQLLSYGCQTAQGYLYSRPLPESDLLKHLRTSNDLTANRA